MSAGLIAERQGQQRRRRASSVVEMAVVAPILIMIIFGIIEFGYAFMTRQMLTNAAREGARVSAIQTVTDEDEVRDAVRDAMASMPSLIIPDSAITITHWCKEADGTPDFTEKVEVTVPYDDISLLGDFFSWLEFSDLEVSSSMRKEGVTEDSDAPVCP
ncbi:MAG: hypothetical protein HJJLKODD_00260 [Phycisphaerae bacterium]|nr:hypothetical protein [Phycisphaerae bacterium]